MYENLNPQKALIFRIEHIDNVAWDLENGALMCRSSELTNPDFVNIGNPELIDKRTGFEVPIKPRGTLSDYVPFYFTPSSVMLFNIVTGRNVQKRSKAEIVIFVSSLHLLVKNDVKFVYTNRHAIAAGADFFSDVESLNQIDWEILQNCDFRTTDDYPDKQSRYQAEALVYKRLPISSLLGLICFDEPTALRLNDKLGELNIELPVRVRPKLYF